MAIAWTELTQGSSDQSSFDSASITPKEITYVAVAVAQAGSSGIASCDVSISGGGLTWNHMVAGGQIYADRRKIFVLRGTGTPSAGVLTFTITTGAGGLAETMYSVDGIDGGNTSDPDDAPQVASTAGATALACPDVGTPDAGDHIYAAFGIEGGTVSATVDDGIALTNLGGGAAVRTLVAFYDDNASDETPSIAWTGTNGAGGIGFIVNVAAAGGRTTKNTRAFPLGTEIGMNHRQCNI